MDDLESSANSGGIVIAKVNWSEFYQGESETKTCFEGGDNFERFNFRRVADCFYGSIPRRAPDKEGNWLVVFIARDIDKRHYAVGWYEDACFIEGDRPEYDLGQQMPETPDGRKFTYSLYAKAAYLLPPGTRHYFKAPSMERFGNATYIYATGSENDSEAWREEFARFAKRVQAQRIDAGSL